MGGFRLHRCRDLWRQAKADDLARPDRLGFWRFDHVLSCRLVDGTSRTKQDRVHGDKVSGIQSAHGWPVGSKGERNRPWSCPRRNVAASNPRRVGLSGEAGSTGQARPWSMGEGPRSGSGWGAPKAPRWRLLARCQKARKAGGMQRERAAGSLAKIGVCNTNAHLAVGVRRPFALSGLHRTMLKRSRIEPTRYYYCSIILALNARFHE